MLEPIGDAAVYLLEPSYWIALFTAVGLAAMASIIPGANSFLVMALAIPIIVFNVTDPAIGLVLLATITGVDNTLDSIPAILFGQPSAATQVTFLEGHQLARQGKAAHTLGAVYSVSALGGLVGAVVLILAIPVIRPFVLEFGFSEIAAMGLIGLAMVSVLSRGAMSKGLIAAMLGMLIAFIGRDNITGDSRLTIGPLFSFHLVPVALGLLALPEMLDLTVSRRPVAAHGADISNREVFRGAREGLRHWRMVIRQSLFGVFLGAIPGVGSAVIDWLSYAFGIFFAKDKTQFGKGSLEGVIFAESAQNAKEGGQAIPTLAMGVPGGPTWVLVLGGMIAYGVAPGPEMLGTNAHITILLVITLALGNLAITMVGLLVTGQLAKLTTVPYPVVGAIIIPIMLLSAFQTTTGWRGIQEVYIMGAVGLAMKHYGWPRPPMLLGFILAPIIERNLQSAISIYGLARISTDILTVTIVAVAVVTGVLFVRAVRRIDQETAAAEKALVEAGIAGPAVAEAIEADAAPPPTSGSAPWLKWHGEYVIHGILAITAVLFLIDTLDYHPRAAAFPRWLSVGVLVLTLYQAGTLAAGRAKRGTIMDLGMTSTGLEGSTRAAIRLGLVMGLFLLVGITLHLAYAALMLGIVIPLIMLRGPGRWPIAILTTGVVFLFIFVVLDNVLYVLYPTPFVTGWKLPWGWTVPY